MRLQRTHRSVRRLCQRPAQTDGSPSTRLRRAFLVAGLWLGVNRFRKLSAVGKSLIAIGPGRVHAWHVKKFTGLYIAFTQEFFDGTRPPPSPSALFDYPFISNGEVSPVVRLKTAQNKQVQNLLR